MIFVNGNAAGWAHGSDWNDPPNRRNPCPSLGRIADCIGTANGWHSTTRLRTPQFSSHLGRRSRRATVPRARLKWRRQKSLSSLVASDPKMTATLVDSTTANLTDDSKAVWVRALGQGPRSRVGKRIHLDIAPGRPSAWPRC